MSSSRALPIVLGGSVVLLGGLILLSPPARALEQRVMETIKDWVANAIFAVAKHEGGGRYDALNANKDGAGVSYGLVQWTQTSGNLGRLLAEMHRRAPEEFARVFGPSYRQVLDVTARGSLDPVDGSSLWKGPWPARFAAAAKIEAFRGAQVWMAMKGDHMQAAIANARRLDVATERGVALCFDRAIQQGAGGSTAIAQNLAGYWTQHPGSRPAAVNDRLAQFAWLCAGKFRRTTAPSGRAYGTSGRLWWESVTIEQSEIHAGSYGTSKVAVSGVWHVFTGLGSLYDDITRRCSQILTATDLRDNPVDLAPATV